MEPRVRMKILRRRNQTSGRRGAVLGRSTLATELQIALTRLTLCLPERSLPIRVWIRDQRRVARTPRAISGQAVARERESAGRAYCAAFAGRCFGAMVRAKSIDVLPRAKTCARRE
jgi:hypothetical protein